MREAELLQEINGDRQAARARKVVYLEGKTDVSVFFALLGTPRPRDGQHQGVAVLGLQGRSGQGGSAVRMRVELAEKHGLHDVYGILDGDGKPFADLATQFDPPFPGPLFTWKAYCIENLLVKTGWPEAFGDPPDWTEVMLAHAPYVALNRVHIRLRDALRTLRLANFNHPHLDKPLATVDSIVAALRQDKHLLANRDVEHEFLDEVRMFEAVVRASLDEAHAHLNGKWLLDVFAPRQCKSMPERCRDAWIDHAARAGGLSEVAALWHRISGRAA